MIVYKMQNELGISKNTKQIQIRVQMLNIVIYIYINNFSSIKTIHKNIRSTKVKLYF